MIYNLVSYLKGEFTTETIFANVINKIYPVAQVPDRCCTLYEDGGSDSPYFRYKQTTIQVISRDKDAVKARELAFKIYNKINSRFGLVLPAVTVGGANFPQVQIAEISANVVPQVLGFDENGRCEYSTNYIVIYK
jgi:hypothetical protein